MIVLRSLKTKGTNKIFEGISPNFFLNFIYDPFSFAKNSFSQNYVSILSQYVKTYSA
jgi:hypothetical protein